jgi:hypothetical protein
VKMRSPKVTNAQSAKRNGVSIDLFLLIYNSAILMPIMAKIIPTIQYRIVTL